MHEIRKFAPEGPETAACIEKNTRIVDAYIKVLILKQLSPDACFCPVGVIAAQCWQLQQAITPGCADPRRVRNVAVKDC